MAKFIKAKTQHDLDICINPDTVTYATFDNDGEDSTLDIFFTNGKTERLDGKWAQMVFDRLTA